MSYSKQTWTNDVSKLNSTRLTHIEDGIEDAAADADTAATAAAAAAATAAAAIAKPGTPVRGDSLSYNGTTWTNFTHFYNVKAFGAVGDGSTDDTTAMQLAITTAINANGGTVYMPPGTYKITAALDFSALKDTNKQVHLQGAGMGNIFGSGYSAPTTIKNSQTGTAIKAYGTLAGATNDPITALKLSNFSVQNQSNLSSNYTLDFDYVISGLHLENLYIHGNSLTGNGIQFRNMAHGQSFLSNVTVRSFGTGVGFRFATEVTSNVDTAPNAGNTHLSACASLDTKTGFQFGGTNLLNGWTLSSCKAVRSSTTVGTVTASVGFDANSQLKSSFFSACHAENYETGYLLTGSEFNVLSGCSAFHPATLLDAGTSGFKLASTATGNTLQSAHVQDMHYGVNFTGDARTNFVTGRDRTGHRIVTSYFVDTSTNRSNVTWLHEGEPNVIEWNGTQHIVERSTAGGVTNLNRITGDTNGRFRIKADGTFEWNDDGSASYDTTLARGEGAGLIRPSGGIEFTERGSDYSAPATDDARLYIRESGGKTQLVIRFATGAIQIIATEP